MKTTHKENSLDEKELLIFRILFVSGAFWNLLGAIFGYFNTAFTYHEFFGRQLTDPLQFAVYRGSWGTTLLYFIGYLLVAHDPVKHSGIVVIGTIGKAFFAAKLLGLYLSGLANPVVLIVVIGDFVFTAAFACYLLRMIFFHKDELLK